MGPSTCSTRLKNCGDRPRETAVFQGFYGIGWGQAPRDGWFAGGLRSGGRQRGCGCTDRQWSRSLSSAVDRTAVRPFLANGSDAVLREFAVARYDRKIIGKRGRDDDSVGWVFVEVWQLGGTDHDVVRWRNGIKAVLFP